VGLDLIVRRQACDHIVIEPVSEEDIAAQLNDEQVRATVRLPSPGGDPIEIQIKLRRSGHWTPYPFAQVLNGAGDEPGSRGPARRTRPIQNLIDTPLLRYVLLTDARVNDDLAAFCVDELGQASTAVALPRDLVAPGAAGVASRIGVLTERTPEVLRLRIAECLRLAHVPGTKHDACIKRLEQAVRSRLLGEMPDRWERDEIETILAEYDGFPERRGLSPLVPPNNYPDLQVQIATRHVLLVTGPPGSGKTHAATHLAQEHRRDADPFEVVEVQGGDGIGKVRSRLDGEGRVLFLIHDPWGMFEADDRAQEWASELPKLARRASAGRKFLITSRTAIKEEHVPVELRNVLTAADIAITEANYNDVDREAILRHALQGASLLQMDFVARHRQRILAQLHLPLAIESFVQGLLTCSMDPEPSLEELIRLSNVEAIGQKVQEEIEARGDDAIAGAVILWSLFSLRQALNPEGARVGRRDAAQGGYAGRSDPEKLLNHFIRSKRLAPADGGAFYAHPTFIEGLDRVVQAHPGVADDVLSGLLAGMCANGRVEQTRGIVRQLRRRNTLIPHAAQAALNRHLIEQIGRADRFDAGQSFADLAELGDGTDPVLLLVKALIRGRSRFSKGFRARWRPEQMSESDVAAIRDSVQAREAARTFVRFGMLDFHAERYQAPDLVLFFGQFGWDLTPVFLEALRAAFDLESGRAPGLAHAALLSGQPPDEDVLTVGLEELDRVRRSLEEMGDRFRSADQGVLDGEESHHLFDQPSERLYGPEKVLEVAVQLRRARAGYEWLVRHPRIADLLEAWVESIEPGTSEDEVKAIIASCPADNHQLEWRAIGRARADGFALQLLDALAGAPEDELPDVIRAVDAVIPRADWPTRVAPVLAGLSLCRRTQIAAAMRHPYVNSLPASGDDGLRPHLFRPEEASAIDACRRWESPESIREMIAAFAEPERAALRVLILSSDLSQAVKAGLVLHELGEDVSAHLSRWVCAAETDARFHAYHLAALLGSKQGRRVLRRRGTADPEYQCRRVVLGHLAANGAEIDWGLVRRAAKDPSAPIRERSARLIGSHRHQAGERTLRALIRDTRDRSEDHYRTIYGGCNFHVARAAAEALDRIPDLAAETISELVAFVRGGEAVCPDWVVHYQAVNCLAWRANPELLPFFVELLADDRYLPGPSRSGFPIRYAAAWGLANSLGDAPDRADSIDLRRVLDGARHPDARLAGPCLIALGFADPRGWGTVREALRGIGDSADRAALYVLAASFATDTPPAAYAELVGAQHPSLEIANRLDADSPITPADWREWVEQRPLVKSWLDGIQSTEGVHAALRYVLWLLAGQGDHDFVDSSGFQANDLAEGSPLVTTRTLLGGE
jgi:hypothetical protein